MNILQKSNEIFFILLSLQYVYVKITKIIKLHKYENVAYIANPSTNNEWNTRMQKKNLKKKKSLS